MRPRHKTAEFDRIMWKPTKATTTASMRPRHKTAEFSDMHDRGFTWVTASMRPRHKTAEFPDDLWECSSIHSCFNEAAA